MRATSGVYGIKVTGGSAGQYELLTVLPEPGSMALFAIAAGAMLARRTHRCAETRNSNDE